MNPGANEVKLRPIEKPSGLPVHIARLVSKGPGVMLLMSSMQPAKVKGRLETILFSVALDEPRGAPAQVLSIPQLLPTPPDWDASWRPGEQLTVAYQRAGGALNAVLLQRDGPESPTPLTARHPFESFSHPRFVRGLAGTPPLVSMIADSRTAVLFEVPQGDKPGSYKKLGACEDALVVARQQGLGLLCKVTVPGPSLQNVLPGRLSYVPLGKDLQPTSAPIELLGGRPVFGFDVDLLGERLVLLAVTAEGPRLDTFEQPPEQAIPLLLPKGSKGNLSSPSIRATASQIYFSFVDEGGSAAGSVLIGQLPVGALR